MKSRNTSIRTIAALVAILAVSYSCKKSTTSPAPKQTTTQLLTSHSWTEIKLEMGNTPTALSTQQFDIVNHAFSASFSATSNDQGNYTTMVGSSNTDNGTWTLSNNETTLTLVSATGFDPIAPTVMTLNSTTLVLLFPKGSYNYVHTDSSSDIYAYQQETFGK
jgi:hypothetical protein